jgi:hypothetical protein
MNEAEDFGFNDPGSREENMDRPNPRAVGSPLPIGAAGRSPKSPGQGDPRRFIPVPPGRALANSPAPPGAGQPSSLQRAVNALRLTLPFLQRLLPLLDGNIATTVTNILTPHPQTPPPPPVDLERLEDGLAELQAQHRDLHNQIVEQNSSLKRVEDQLEMVRDATDRNTLEQQELLEDLKTVGHKVNLFTLLFLGLLTVSIVLTVILYMHIQRVLP